MRLQNDDRFQAWSQLSRLRSGWGRRPCDGAQLQNRKLLTRIALIVLRPEAVEAVMIISKYSQSCRQGSIYLICISLCLTNAEQKPDVIRTSQSTPYDTVTIYDSRTES